MKDGAKYIVFIVVWVVGIATHAMDRLIQFMLFTRSNERTVRPAERIPWPPGLKQQLMKRQGNRCTYCGYRRPHWRFEIDHMTPVVLGGSNDLDNLQVICRPCNMRKGIQTDEQFRARYARLVPLRRLTPPSRQIVQREFTNETRVTTQHESVARFRRSKFYPKNYKIGLGCLVLGAVVAVLTASMLDIAGAHGFVLAPVTLLVASTAGGAVWIRAYITGAMEEEN